MANVYHANISDPYLHEPKGVATASTGEVYVADGAGSGDWMNPISHISGYIPFGIDPVAYQHNVTTVYSVLNPTFLVETAKDFTGETTPNARLRYVGVRPTVATFAFTFNYKNNSGTSRNVELLFYRNGIPMNGGHIVVTATSGEWNSATLSDMIELNPNDYIEVAVKADANFTLDVASASLIIRGRM